MIFIIRVGHRGYIIGSDHSILIPLFGWLALALVLLSGQAVVITPFGRWV